MTLPSPRKRQTTAPNTRAATKANLLKATKACLFAALLLTYAAPTAATPGWRAARNVRPQVAQRKDAPAKPQARVQVAAVQVAAPVVRDARVVRVAWEDYDPASQDFSAEAAGRAMLDESVEAAVYDPFEAPAAEVESPTEELRVAQLPDDPFDEPSFDDLLLLEPKAEEATTAEAELDQLDEAAQGIDAELERREQQPLSVEGDNPFELPTMPSEEAKPLKETLLFEMQADEENFESGSGDQEQAWQTFTPEQREAIDKQLAEEKLAHQEECKALREYLNTEGIREINLKITVDGNPGEDFPFECGIGTAPYQPRQWSEITYMWTASRLYHKPLYFEQPQLERYGHTWGPFVQPIMSGAHFFGTVPFLPFAMGLEPPGECIYTLGHYRPGNCAPWLLETTPRNLRPYLFESGVGAGLFFLIP